MRVKIAAQNVCDAAKSCILYLDRIIFLGKPYLEPVFRMQRLEILGKTPQSRG